MDIDLNFLKSSISSRNNFYTNLARKEELADIDMKKQNGKLQKSDEDVSTTDVKISFEDGSVLLKLYTNDNNESATWKKNFYTMAKSLLYSDIRELFYLNAAEIKTQITPQMRELLMGGVS